MCACVLFDRSDIKTIRQRLGAAGVAALRAAYARHESASEFVRVFGKEALDMICAGAGQ